MPDGYSGTLHGKIACVFDGLCEWTTADTILAWVCIVWLLACALMVAPALAARRRRNG